MTTKIQDGELTLSAPQPKLLPFDVWATVEARLTGEPPEERERLIAAREIDPRDWAHSATHWLAAIAADVGSGQLERPMRYGALCREEMIRRASSSASADADEKQLPAPESLSEPQPPLAKPAGPDPQVPTYLMPNSGGNALEVEEVDVESTLEALLDRGATLPFGARASADFQAWLSREPAAKPRSGPEDSSDYLDGTAMIIRDSVQRPATPFEQAAAPPPTMPIEQYASLCAALAVFPQRRDEILGRFGIGSPSAKESLDRAWRSAFDRSPSDFSIWRALYDKFCAALAAAK